MLRAFIGVQRHCAAISKGCGSISHETLWVSQHRGAQRDAPCTVPFNWWHGMYHPCRLARSDNLVRNHVIKFSVEFQIFRYGASILNFCNLYKLHTSMCLHLYIHNASLLLMTVSAVEQLQVMASKRQYKEAAAQLEVT